MKCTSFLLPIVCYCLLFAASNCFAQMYTVTDLGTLGGTQSYSVGINASGQVVGWSLSSTNTVAHAFRTAPNSPINPATDDLGTPFGATGNVLSDGINASGEVACHNEGFFTHAFRTAPNSPINSATDDLGTLGGSATIASGINASGQVVGWSLLSGGNLVEHAFRTAADSAINPTTDDPSVGNSYSSATGINASGQVVGWFINVSYYVHAFRTAPNSPINPATDDLGTLGDGNSTALGINDSGQAVGWAYTSGGNGIHAFRTAPNGPINPATDDLGTLGGSVSIATGVDAYGQVVGTATTTGNTAAHIFLYSGGVMHDLNNLLAPDTSCVPTGSVAINDGGQIAGNAVCRGQQHAVLLNPIYKAFVQPPIRADGSSVFSAMRGTVPVKFTLTQYDAPTCALPPATIAVTRTVGGTLGQLDESSYLTRPDSDSNFRIDETPCEYIYNLRASSLGVGTFRVDISNNGIMIGHAVFVLE